MGLGRRQTRRPSRSSPLGPRRARQGGESRRRRRTTRSKRGALTTSNWSLGKSLSDKELYAAFAAVPKGVRLASILSDSCHAGGMDRLEVLRTKRRRRSRRRRPSLPDAPLLKQARHNEMGVIDAQFALACRESELSADTQDARAGLAGHSPHFFLIALRAKADLTFKQIITSNRRAAGRAPPDMGTRFRRPQGLGVDRKFLE